MIWYKLMETQTERPVELSLVTAVDRLGSERETCFTCTVAIIHTTVLQLIDPVFLFPLPWPPHPERLARHSVVTLRSSNTCISRRPFKPRPPPSYLRITLSWSALCRLLLPEDLCGLPFIRSTKASSVDRCHASFLLPFIFFSPFIEALGLPVIIQCQTSFSWLCPLPLSDQPRSSLALNQRFITSTFPPIILPVIRV